ncbi:MAG: EamA family transporter RarD, partial [Rhodobacteraceae bacterium]|nr:EamA family transporter RarD [Paracoccaceae bacterium]
PTLQIGCATLIMGDAFTRWHVLALVLIWMALALYSAESWRQDRAARRAVVSVSTSGTTAK